MHEGDGEEEEDGRGDAASDEGGLACRNSRNNSAA